MKTNKVTVITLAEKCKNILAANWQGHLNTIKADAKGSKEDIYTSKVKYILKRGKPYIWVPEKELHNVNAIIDERGSFAVASPFPGPLATLLQSIKKLPTRVALSGDVVPLNNQKAQIVTENLKEIIQSEQKVSAESSYTVSGVLSSSNFLTTRSENLKELLDEDEKYVIYKFNLSSCMFVDGYGCTHEIDLRDIETSKADLQINFFHVLTEWHDLCVLSGMACISNLACMPICTDEITSEFGNTTLVAPLSARLIDGINQSPARRRALMLFCFVYSKANARDAMMLSVDRKGFDVLVMVPSPVMKEGIGEFQWKEFRFTFKEDATDVESFCRQLVEMEEEVVKKVSSYSGLA